MSLDVEGTELKVLNGIDFSKVEINYIVMENDKGNEKALRNFLWDKGYKIKAKLWWDEIWMKIK